MVFLKEDHHAVVQLDPLRLLWVKCGQGRPFYGGNVAGGQIVLRLYSRSSFTCRRGLRRGRSLAAAGPGSWRSRGLCLPQQEVPHQQNQPQNNWTKIGAGHYCFSFCVSCAGFFADAFSIMATVRFPSTKVLPAMRQMSALVTLSMRSTARKSSRQSP